MKKIAFIIAFKDFRDEEYFVPKQMLDSEGFEIKTVSRAKGVALGKLGGEAAVDILLEDLKANDFDAVLFAGGPGAHLLIEDRECHRIAREALEKGKVLGAICIAPAILAKAGVLQGKKATVWTSQMDKSAVRIIEENGGEFISSSVVEDGNVITSSGPEAAEEFASKIIEKLK